jgi:heat shock protein HslJ
MDLMLRLLHSEIFMNFRILSVAVLATLISGCAQTPRREAAAPVAAPAKVVVLKELAGTRWTLSVLEGNRVYPSNSGWATPGLDFARDEQSVTGFAGVNRFGGRYTQDGAALTFGPLALTRRIGPVEQTELEARFTRVLSGVTGWRQRGENLELISAGRVGAVFTPVVQKK